jgi:hypothetical protein
MRRWVRGTIVLALIVAVVMMVLAFVYGYKATF